MDAVPEGQNCCPPGDELEAEARWHSLAIALAELPARLVQQAVAQLGHPNFSHSAHLEANHILLMGDSGSGKSSPSGKSSAMIAQRERQPSSTTRRWSSRQSSTRPSAAI